MTQRYSCSVVTFASGFANLLVAVFGLVCLCSRRRLLPLFFGLFSFVAASIHVVLSVKLLIDNPLNDRYQLQRLRQEWNSWNQDFRASFQKLVRV
jgi:hypothetical protein